MTGHCFLQRQYADPVRKPLRTFHGSDPRFCSTSLAAQDQAERRPGMKDGRRVPFGAATRASIPAVVNSIDRSTENRAPNRCLPFDGIGARHPGIVASSGNTTANGNLVPAPGVIRDAEPQYHHKVNNNLGLYSLWNGLSN